MASYKDMKAAYEDGRKQAISPTRFCGDRVELPGNTELHPHWIDGFLHYNGTYKEIGEAYHLYLRS